MIVDDDERRKRKEARAKSDRNTVDRETQGKRRGEGGTPQRWDFHAKSKQSQSAKCVEALTQERRGRLEARETAEGPRPRRWIGKMQGQSLRS